MIYQPIGGGAPALSLPDEITIVPSHGLFWVTLTSCYSTVPLRANGNTRGPQPYGEEITLTTTLKIDDLIGKAHRGLPIP